MKVIVNKNYVLFDVNTKVNKREFKATPLEFSFSEDYEGLTCKCVFSKIPATQDEEVTFYQQPIINNKCYIPYEVMDAEGILIGVYGYSVDGEELLLRYSPKPKNLWFLEGSYYEGAETPEEILPSQFEQYVAYLNSQIARLNQIKIETEQLSDGVKISVTNADGETTETEIYNGETGPQGPQGEPGTPGEPGAPGRDGVIQYTAGTGIDITNNVISATSSVDVPLYFWDGTAVDTGDPRLEMFQEIFDKYRNNEPYILQTYRLFVTSATMGNDNASTINLIVSSNTRAKVNNYMYLVGREFGVNSDYQNGLMIYGINASMIIDTSTNTVTSVGSVNPIYTIGCVPYQWSKYTNGGYLTLSTTNTVSYTPTDDYHPATKKYVDDNVNPTIYTTSNSSVTISDLTGNYRYKLSELTTLIISATTTFDRESVIYFSSGTTGTSVSLPDSITNIGDAPTMTNASNVNTGTCEANKSYIISVENNIAIWKAY